MENKKVFCIYCLDNREVAFIEKVEMKDGFYGEKSECLFCKNEIFSLIEQ